MFLVYRGQTVRMLLPNEVTTMETVRALFVRAFPALLSMASFAPHVRSTVFLMKPDTKIFAELTNMRCVIAANRHRTLIEWRLLHNHH